ncbi:MAG: heavy-metal-associated domain-containing protein [Cellulomonas sp.]|uniref:heavy-metal-associated domain-containing protein n=1 Tax=Cellulomonas sp. TaxID=40001 RepID=UPI0017AF2F19|nr:heavy-metal-associated domain-containing protein [Cellulomonas sp.]NMM29862.1 heavy-metal-associated domain-containing protein [Cellulomonas sp.]
MSQTTTFSVDGMTCGHCVQHVTTELTAIPGVRDVSIELVNGGSSPVTVVSDDPLTDEAIAAAIDEAGYALTPKGSLL